MNKHCDLFNFRHLWFNLVTSTLKRLRIFPFVSPLVVSAEGGGEKLLVEVATSRGLTFRRKPYWQRSFRIEACAVNTPSCAICWHPNEQNSMFLRSKTATVFHVVSHTKNSLQDYQSLFITCKLIRINFIIFLVSISNFFAYSSEKISRHTCAPSREQNKRKGETSFVSFPS